MEEKEKRTSKEEGSGYGLTADNDSCRLADSDSSEPTDSNSCEPADSNSCGLATDNQTPFSENAEIRRLQNAFGEALGDLPLPDEVREEWSTFLQRQTLSPHLFIRWCGSSHCPVIVTLVPLAHHRQGRHPAEHRNLHRPPCTGTNYHYRRERQNHRIYPARHDHPPHIGGRKSRPFKCKQPSGIPQRVFLSGKPHRKPHRRSTLRSDQRRPPPLHRLRR